MKLLPFLLLVAVAWELFLRWRGRSVGRRASLLQALRRAEEELRGALEGRK